MSDYLSLPEWNATRTIYKKLSDEFDVLTDAYSLKIEERKKIMLDHLILGIDEVDFVIDPLPERWEREAITASILNYLDNQEKTWNHSLATASLVVKIQNLKLIVQELKVAKRFHTGVANIFDFTERKRHTLNASELIELVQLEGRATAELPLSILGLAPNHAFSKFFANLCMLMGIADLIIDARSDYHSNYISVKPSLLFYLQLNAILIKDGLKLVWNFPKKIQFLRYCIKFSFLLLTAKD